MGAADCVHYYGLTRAQGAAFEFHGQLKLVSLNLINSSTDKVSLSCPWLIVDTQAISTLNKEIDMSAWVQHATVRRPSDNNEDIVLYRNR